MKRLRPRICAPTRRKALEAEARKEAFAAVEERDRVLRCALYWQYSRLRQASENTGVARAIVCVAPLTV